MLLSYIVTLSDGLGLPTGEDFVNKVFPNIPSFVVQLAAFIILSIIVIKFAYKPVSKFIKKRREFVESTLDETRKENAEAKAKNEEAIKNLNDSKKQAMVIVEDAKKEAESQRQVALEEVKKELALKRQEALKDLEKEKDKARKELYDEVVNLALDASKELLNREVDSEDNKKLVASFIDELESEK